MSLTNEQRAHDLAIAAATILLRNDDYISNQNNELEFYKIYLQAYKNYLDQIKSDF